MDLAFLKRVRKSRTQQSLATIIVKKNADLESLGRVEQLLIDGLIKIEFHPTEEYIMGFYLHLVEQMVKIEDANTPKRVHIL